MLGLIGIILALIVLISMAYRGHSVLVAAPIAASIAVVFAGMPLLASYPQVFMPALGGFVISFFPLFITGAVFGKLMSETGYAQAISTAIVERLGADRAVLATVVTGAILTYGGISVFVVAFGLFPIARELFRAADIPRRLIPATMALGCFTFTMSALPGSPQVQNTIPTAYFGTTTFAAPLAGLVASVLIFTLGYMWIMYRVRRLQKRGETFESMRTGERKRRFFGKKRQATVASSGGHANSSATTTTLTKERPQSGATVENDLPERPPQNAIIAIIPLVLVIGLNLALSQWLLPAMNADYLETDEYGNTTISQVAGLWSVVVAILVAIAFIFVVNMKSGRQLVDSVHEGAKNSVVPIFSTASEVGFGSVVAAMPAFLVIRDGLLSMSGNPLVTTSVATTTLAGITGSASGGMSIALEAFGENLRTMAVDQGVSLELMHRMTSIAAGGLDTLPHSGAIVTLFLICGVTHRQGYKDFGMVTIVIPLLVVPVLILLAMAGLL
jgi:H+/gluconate symporter-like permease